MAAGRTGIGMTILCGLCALGLFLLGCSTSPHENKPIVGIPIDSVLQTLHFPTDYYFSEESRRKTATFYQRNNHAAIWLDRKHPTPLFYAFLDEIGGCADDAMNPDDYRAREILQEALSLYRDDPPAEEALALLEVKITATFFLFTTHLLEGRVQHAGSGGFIWKKDTASAKDVVLLLNAKKSSSLQRAMKNLRPADPQYEALRTAFKKYRLLPDADAGVIPWHSDIAPGERDVTVPAIRRRLMMTDLEGKIPRDSLLYDPRLAAAVARFQKRHGLDQTRVIDEPTINELNVPLSKRIETIGLNLERMRWKPHLQFTETDILVNAPEFSMRILEHGKSVMNMKVILGSEYDPTPIFHDTLKYLVLNPTWTVPRSIIRDEFIPLLRKNPEYYLDKGYRFYRNGEEVDPLKEKWTEKNLYEYLIVQKPGSNNALGRVKFVLPNNFAIYLHDTPAGGLFARKQRALSHGCIRVERPMELAAYLLRDQYLWDESALQAVVDGGKTKSIRLSRPVPVHIIYRTAWVDEEGLVNFRNDIYGHDARQLSRINNIGRLSVR